MIQRVFNRAGWNATEFHGFRFRVLRRNRNRITALRITPLTRKPVRLAQVQSLLQSGAAE